MGPVMPSGIHTTLFLMGFLYVTCDFRVPNGVVQLVRGIMLKVFTLRIKVSNFAEMFVLDYSLRKNMAPREIETLTFGGAIKMGRKRWEYIKHLQLFI